MLSFSRSLRVFVAVETCDIRKGFEGLSALVSSALNEEGGFPGRYAKDPLYEICRVN